MRFLANIVISFMLVMNVHRTESTTFFNWDHSKMLDVEQVNINASCDEAMTAFVDGILSGQAWALQMLDASGKLNSGLLQGATFSPGNVFECLSTEIPLQENSTQSELQRTTYCDAFLYPAPSVPENATKSAGIGSFLPPGLSLHSGICLPRECSSPEEATTTLQSLLPIDWELAVQVISCSNTLELPTPVDYQILIFIVLSIFIVLAIAGTFLELKTRCQNDQPKKVSNKLEKSVLAFSVISNTRTLLDTTPRKGVIECLHGIRFLSMAWVVLGHTFVVVLPSIFVNNPTKLAEIMSSWTVLPIYNGTFSVDTFFMMSGLLVTYILMKQLEKSEGKFNIFLFYLHRYLRLTPPYAIMLAVSVAVMPMLGISPVYQAAFGLSASRETCSKWWAHILYIRNMWYEGLLCMGQGWYLQNDMQFYIFAPLIALPLYHFRNSKMFTHGYLVLWVLLSIGSTTAVLYARDISGVYDAVDFVVPAPPGTPDRTNIEYYIKPWCRFGPYIIGMYTGYLLHLWRDKPPTFSAWFVGFMWCMTTALCLSVIFGLERYMLFPEDLQSFEIMPRDLDIWYAALSRNAWAFGIAWIVVACHLGYGGPIGKFLGWGAFKPLSNLSYSSYLVHIAVLIHYGYERFGTYYLDIGTIAFSFVGVLTITHIVAYFMAMVFEYPFVKLERIWLTDAVQEKQLLEKQ